MYKRQVNTVEFFVTAAISATFIFTIGLQSFTNIIIGMLVGGLLAAPLGAFLAKKIKPKQLLFMVGAVLTITSVYNVYKAIGG